MDKPMIDRPCFYAFKDIKTGLYWMIPFSSKITKFRSEYEKKMNKYGRCDTIAFGLVLGHEKAFLIQNMCPVIAKYIKNEYLDAAANTPVRLDGAFEKDLVKKAQKVLQITKRGNRLIFPNVLKIEQELLKENKSLI